MKADDIARALYEARDHYYNGQPLMSDEEFDRLEEELKALNPEHEYFSTVGVMPVSGTKITHRIPMLSMAKAKTVEDVEKWIARLALPEGTSFLLEAKIDGLSCDLRYEKGKLKHVASRGNGYTGQDISHIASYLKDIPAVISTDAEVFVRGELYLPRNTEFPNPQNKPLRNIAVGLVNRKDRDLADLSYLRFVAYQMLGDIPFARESEKLQRLGKDFDNVLNGHLVKNLNELRDYYVLYLESLRDQWEYETDGLTITVDPVEYHDLLDNRWVLDHHHHYQIAWKPPSEFRETILREVEWNLSKHGSMIPVAIFDPVVIGGARIVRAALNNAENVERMRLAPGDRLIVQRSNDVIPYVAESIKTSDSGMLELPKVCPYCGELLVREGVHLRCKNDSCPEIQIQRIIFWIKQSGIEGVSEQTVRRLWNEGLVREIKDIYGLKREDISELDRFGDRSADNIVQAIESSRHMSARALIARMGIEGVGERSLERLGIKTVKDFLDFNDTTYIIGQRIIEWKTAEENIKLFNSLLEAVDIMEDLKSESRPKVCMTGSGPMPRKELIRELEKAGYEFSETVSKDTEILLSNDPEGNSSKLKKARAQGIKIMSYEEFFKDQFEGSGSLF